MHRFAFALAGAAALAACAAEPAETHTASVPVAMAQNDDAQIAEGRQLAERLCVTCHAVRAEGPSRNAEAPPLRTLAERYPGTLLADAFPQRMKVGHPAMPDFGLSDDQVDALLAYLLSIQERQGA